MQVPGISARSRRRQQEEGTAGGQGTGPAASPRVWALALSGTRGLCAGPPC